MKSLLFHCKKFNAKITGVSTRGIDVSPEKINKKIHKHDSNIAAFITVESGDDFNQIVSNISNDIKKFCLETKEDQIILFPFAHLSSNLASFKDGIKFFDMLEEELNLKNDKLSISRVHFGSDKDLLIHIWGHPGNVRFREY